MVTPARSSERHVCLTLFLLLNISALHSLAAGAATKDLFNGFIRNTGEILSEAGSMYNQHVEGLEYNQGYELGLEYQSSTTQTITITNHGNDAIVFERYEIETVAEDRNSLRFESLPEMPYTLNPSTTMSFLVYANAEKYHHRPEYLYIWFFTPGEMRSAAHIFVEKSILAPNIFLYPRHQYDFGDILVGEQKEVDVDIYNQGAMDLIVNAIEISPPDIGYEIVGKPDLPLHIPPSESAGVRVRFTGLSPGEKEANFHTEHNDPYFVDASNDGFSIVGFVQESKNSAKTNWTLYQ